jgi:hypothetical protein
LDLSGRLRAAKSGAEMKEKLGELTLKDLENKNLQDHLIEESDDPEFIRVILDSFNTKRKDSLTPNK